MYLFSQSRLAFFLRFTCIVAIIIVLVLISSYCRCIAVGASTAHVGIKDPLLQL